VTHDQQMQPGDRVTAQVPASTAYVAVLRSLAAGVAARFGLTIDDVEDVRMAVDEACALLLPQAVAGSDLECVVVLEPSAVAVEVAVRSQAPRPVPRDGFAWTVLEALTHELDDRVAGNRLVLELRKNRIATA
jgi:serine/threonine-protein kinase RsbW